MQDTELENLESFLITKDSQISEEAYETICGFFRRKMSSTLFDILTSQNCLKYKNAIIEVLEKYNFNVYDFYSVVLQYLAMDEDIPSDRYTKGLFIKEIKRHEDSIEMNTEHGYFQALCAVENLKDHRLFYDKYMGLLSNNCHRYSEYLTRTKKYDSVTSLCALTFGGKYVHSYNIDDEGRIVDLANNLILDETDFNLLYQPTEINRVNYEELMSYMAKKPKETKEYCPLYALARQKPIKIDV